MNSGIAILSRWPFASGRRIALPKIAAQSGIRRYFYLKRAILDTRMQIPGLGEVAALNVHAAAYATDDTKRKHVALFKQELDRLKQQGLFFVAGGDLNTLPPDATKIDGFPDSVCVDEFNVARDPEELTWLVPYYQGYTAAISREQYKNDEAKHFTHSVSKDHFWNRKLDYLFTNGRIMEPGETHQQTMELSDHCPVSATFAPAGAP
jgi:endonuclease/exonuclease/phosphatase family metal-dependent hydrolase